jgi:hypothetical protein
MGGYLKVLAQSTTHLGKPFVAHLHSFPLTDVKLLVIQVVHHLFASRCKCVLIVPIKLRGIIPFLYRVIPKIGRNTYAVDRQDVKRRCSKSGIRQKSVRIFMAQRNLEDQIQHSQLVVHEN